MLPLLVALAAPAHAVVGSAGAYPADSLAHAQDFDAIGLVEGSDCVVVLVAPRQAVGLASCVDGADEIRLGDGVALDRRAIVDRIEAVPDHTAGGPGDLAVLHLTSSVADVDPLPITLRDPRGERGRIVGFGPWGTVDAWPDGATSGGERRAVDNAIDDHDAELGLRVDFDAPDGSGNSLWLVEGVQSGATGVPDEGIAGPDDVGAALLVPSDAGWRLVGLFQEVDGLDGEPGDIGSIARFLPLSTHAAFLDAQDALWSDGDAGADPADTGVASNDEVRTGWAGGPARCAAAPLGAGVLALMLSAVAVLRRRES
ncbi:MAG: hypothetical protein H6742_10040 [Alphaproteobacteria bacterium]|nr:hypothetical protein [Alphaproteobacteria bacterium]